jgi:type I restriction enzyme S subunit
MGAFRTDQTRADARYLAYQLQTGPFRNWISTILAGSSINNLRPKDVEDFMVGVPSVEEQAAIARVLAEMDDELDVLQQRLTKLRGIKRGMSQHLLTGRIRVGLRETMS